MPTYSLVTSSSHVNNMICSGVDHPFCLEACRMGTKRGAMAGGKQVHGVIWADGAGDDGESPDSRRKTSGKQVGMKKYP